jgi:peptidoglycan/LPS O-acetylase OafA/YrhL
MKPRAEAAGLHGRNSDLDALRGIACLMVVLWHYAGSIGTAEFGSAGYYALLILRLTWSGVDLFFMLSGFLIAQSLYALRSRKRPLRDFAWRRAARLMPLYYACLIAYMFLLGLASAGLIANPQLLPAGDASVMWAPLYLHNVLGAFAGWTGIHIPISAFSISWSLCVEVQLYIVMASLVTLVRWDRGRLFQGNWCDDPTFLGSRPLT